jgi:hypothetical protein
MALAGYNSRVLSACCLAYPARSGMHGSNATTSAHLSWRQPQVLNFGKEESRFGTQTRNWHSHKSLQSTTKRPKPTKQLARWRFAVGFFGMLGRTDCRPVAKARQRGLQGPEGRGTVGAVPEQRARTHARVAGMCMHVSSSGLALLQGPTIARGRGRRDAQTC